MEANVSIRRAICLYVLCWPAMAQAVTWGVFESYTGSISAESPHLIRLGEDAEFRVVKDSAPMEAASPFRWYLAVPVAKDYDNRAACEGQSQRSNCRQPIEYRKVELETLRGRREFNISEAPLLTALGSHRLAVESVSASEPVSDHFTEEEVWNLPEIVVRRDDTYVGYLTEMIGAPFVLGPTRVAGRGHQTDLRYGADCVALVIYGQRRLGRSVPYVAPRVLFEFAQPVDDGSVREGDILHFGFQTAVLSRDQPPIGWVTPNDRVIHTYHESAEETSFGELPYREYPLRILRWPQPSPPAPPSTSIEKLSPE